MWLSGTVSLNRAIVDTNSGEKTVLLSDMDHSWRTIHCTMLHTSTINTLHFIVIFMPHHHTSDPLILC